MSSDRPDEYQQSPAHQERPMRGEPEHDTGSDQHGHEPPRESATVLVRGETIRDPEQKAEDKSTAKESAGKGKDSGNSKDEKSSRKKVSEAKAKLQSRLPALNDDADIGIQKDYVVVRDGKADLAFTGTLLASAAPTSAPKGHWQEYRVYETNGGKHVFSKIGRSVYAEDQDTHQAEVFDPAPASVPSQLLRSARDLARARPVTWMDAAVAFFGYDPLAKALYRKLSGQFEEHIG
jgi:hypothetical protein